MWRTEKKGGGKRKAIAYSTFAGLVISGDVVLGGQGDR